MTKGDREWLVVVASLRARAESQRWRLAALDGIPYWQQVAVAWAARASETQAAGMGHACPPGVKGFDAELGWAWGVVESWVDAAVSAMDRSTPLSSADAYIAFTALQQQALVFPDGTVAKTVLDLIDREQSIVDIDLARTQQRGVSHLARMAAAEERRKAKAKGPTP